MTKVVTARDTEEVRHIRQSINGCVLCPRKWYEHSEVEKAGGTALSSVGRLDDDGQQMDKGEL